MPDLPAPDHDAQKSWDEYEARRKRGEVQSAADAAADARGRIKGAYESAEPRQKPEPKPSTRTYPEARTAQQAEREAAQRMRDGLEVEN